MLLRDWGIHTSPRRHKFTGPIKLCVHSAFSLPCLRSALCASSEAQSWGGGQAQVVKGECEVNKSFRISASRDLEFALKGRAGNAQKLVEQSSQTCKEEISRAIVP